MYPGTILNYIDNSKINTQENVALDTRSPLWMMASAFDKGPEDLKIVDANSFYQLYGDTMNFEKYGQLNLQAKNIIDNGGRLWVKRLVADDATYGNLYYKAKVDAYITYLVRARDIVYYNISYKTSTDPETIANVVCSKNTDGNYVVVESTTEVLPVGNVILSNDENIIGDPQYNSEKTEQSAISNHICLREKKREGESTVYVYTDVETGVTIDYNGIVGTPEERRAAKITWSKGSKVGCKSYNDLWTEIKSVENPSQPDPPAEGEDPAPTPEPEYVPFAFIDNGRGGSVQKSIRFAPDYNLSRNTKTTFYNFEVYEGASRDEYNTVTIDPTIIINNKPYKLYKEDYTQIDAYAYESSFDKLVDAIYTTINVQNQKEKISRNDIRKFDLLYGYTNRGETTPYIIVEFANGTEIPNSKYGVELENGSDGSFADIEYIQEDGSYKYDEKLVEKMISFYRGEYTQMIYDVDNVKLYGIADANLPFSVKQAITEYIVFRNDCFFFRDLTIDKTEDYGSIIAASNKLRDYDSIEGKPFINTFMYADYFSTYEIIDPESRNRERVTMIYDLVSCLTRSYINNPFSPNAGTYNGYVLESALPDTLNFTPLKTPKVNYKQSIDDARLNYAVYEANNNLVVQSLYTKNRIYSQLSYISNVLSMQEIGRQVAIVCPQVRFSLQLTGNDVTSYTKLINSVLERYSGSFDKLNLVYSADELHVSQKIFYASIEFSFANWYQTEIFDLIANPTTIVIDEVEE